jgi:E1-E2 ATPase
VKSPHPEAGCPHKERRSIPDLRVRLDSSGRQGPWKENGFCSNRRRGEECWAGLRLWRTRCGSRWARNIVRVALHRDAFESFVFAVALAVGLTPEFLPMITSVTLARGAVRMAKEEVIVKHLPAIQNFGSIDILCSDKTGTLTTGVITLHA